MWYWDQYMQLFCWPPFSRRSPCCWYFIAFHFLQVETILLSFMNSPLVFFSSHGGVTTHQLLLEIILLNFIQLYYIMSLSFYFVPFFAGLILLSRFYYMFVTLRSCFSSHHRIKGYQFIFSKQGRKIHLYLSVDAIPRY